MKLQRLVVSALCGGMLLVAQADNTKRNKRDQSGHTATADKQGESAGDLEITRKIRKSLVDDASLSTYARNVKIVTVNGKVSLRGPVKDADEKKKVETLAASAAGLANISSELEIVNKP